MFSGVDLGVALLLFYNEYIIKVALLVRRLSFIMSVFKSYDNTKEGNCKRRGIGFQKM